MADSELSVQGETVETLYREYSRGRYVVNRRYQRKLIWTIDEKISFIDSLSRSYPVPIILFAESSSKSGAPLEIIDGMQRLNAIFSFIENDYAFDGHFFDLDTMATTKRLKDDGKLTQKQPVLDRTICVSLSVYRVPTSIFEFDRPERVDDVFRRVNSGGRRLSRQELRAASSLSPFASSVRQIAAEVRGDVSHSNILQLKDMASISITRPCGRI